MANDNAAAAAAALWYVYVVRNRNDPQKVYTGATNRPAHRLEAHQGRRSGGAVTTSRWGRGAAEMIILVGPFPSISATKTSKSAALSFERKLKRTRVGKGGTRGRILAIYKLIEQLSKSVSASEKVVLSAYAQPLRIQFAHPRRVILSAAATRARPEPIPGISSLVRVEWECRLPAPLM